ncbi:LysR family transcriptional regulator [Ralstonia solanacearum]|uniref:LysR family transcriptional regulator n=1 Tax=Ralstonia solanacearum TaxID=305 RepID=UPI00078BEC53|nr:LysR family transcriptional regulator [Ralstonia solanacearum]AMP37093.1 hypothetical protein LBM2029_05830 [Ralstonia solanacearum]AXV85907.1 LysR family transcriptional regulator [Ralstonia solanacearum]AXW05413.1 LysR family transcriptional regulator [Ralstonia solanacearum]AXW23154.1 LysR family transcriptional regulator [Ralstonia solanacearum]AXW80086.1 LysR family transcriptional regulator [Ralstonia solanacearum]
MSLDSIEVFVEVVSARSFTRAGERLGMPTTTVSAKIARLEKRLGVTLIQRTTRQLHVTPAGMNYYDRCVRALAELSEGERELAAARDEPSGLLRITAPPDLAQTLLTPLVERFLQTYPKVSIELVITTRTVDLIAERIGLAVRVGPIDDSSLVIRRFCAARTALWAAPAYLDRMGHPQQPEDLARHDLIRFSLLGERVALKTATGEVIDVDFASRLASDDLDSVKTYVLRGNGIGLLPEFIGEQAQAPSPLVRVLPAYASEVRTVYFAYPAQRFVPQAVRAFIATATVDARSTAL